MPGGFDLTNAERFAVGTVTQGFGPIAICHDHDDDDLVLCAGYVRAQLLDGVPNINLRIEMIRRRLLGTPVEMPEGDADLLDTYEEMVAKMQGDPGSRRSRR